MVDEPKDVRLPIMVTKGEAQAIDDWRFANRVSTRAEAIRLLIRHGLDAQSDAGDNVVRISGESPAWRVPEWVAKAAHNPQLGPVTWTGVEPQVGRWLESEGLTEIGLSELYERAPVFSEMDRAATGSDGWVGNTMKSLGWSSVTIRSGRGKPAEIKFLAPRS